MNKNPKIIDQNIIHPFEIASLTGKANSTENVNPMGIRGKSESPSKNKFAHNKIRFSAGKVQMNPSAKKKQHTHNILYISRYFYVLSRTIPKTKEPEMPAIMKIKPARDVSVVVYS